MRSAPRVGSHSAHEQRPCPRQLTMMTATTMAAMPMRYSFPEKSSSIFWWQSSCRGSQWVVSGQLSPKAEGTLGLDPPPPGEVA